MGSKVVRGTRYYDTRREASMRRRKGERIYYAEYLGYFIVRPDKDKNPYVKFV